MIQQASDIIDALLENPKEVAKRDLCKIPLPPTTET